MITEQQRKDRVNYIGGSDVAAILGISPFKTPYQLYLEKKCLVDRKDEETPFQYWGSTMEPILVKEFEKRNFVSIKPEIDTQWHPLYPFLRGNIDGWIPELNAVFEAKTTSAYNADKWGEQGTDQIPPEYLVQVAFYCAVMCCESAYIAVLIGGNDYREYKYTRNEELETKIITASCEFWDCVQNDIPPNASNADDLKLMFPKSLPLKVVAADENILYRLTSLNEIKSNIARWQEYEEIEKFHIMDYMQDSEALVDESNNTLVTWKTNKKGIRSLLIKNS